MYLSTNQPTTTTTTTTNTETMAFLQLFVLLTIMFISTFVLGSLPLSLSTTLSPIRFHQLSIFSVGLLIGAALTIVIPEGIDTIYSSSSSSSSTSPATGSNSSLSAPNLTGPSVDQPIPNSHHHHSTIGLALMGGFMLMFLIDQLTRVRSFGARKSVHKPAPGHDDVDSRRTAATKRACSSSAASQTAGLLANDSWQQDGLILRLVAGLRNGTHVSSSSEEDDSEGEEEEEEEGRGNDEEMGLEEVAEVVETRKRKTLKTHSFSTVIGLMTHSVADGIALGASATHTTHKMTKREEDSEGGGGLSLDLIIFLAIMIHKAPAAFGMVALLLNEGLGKGTVRRMLLAFSLAAPLGALITWSSLALVSLLSVPTSSPDNPQGSGDMQWWIGVTLLFSAGTFLFVATHALQNSSSKPVDPCCPQLLPLPTSQSPQSSTHHPLPSSSSPSAAAAAAAAAADSPISVGPLLTCALMVSGMSCPWLLTFLIGGHHH
ncbi:hypothetical protein PCASD_24907 [Puccinia coronata f. sp. avenae]|uniref:Zinc/iron permease n=1 Tax=Puccinia coronata f. sp. avenae TaxID=200324 RepID=A0A2N5S4W0_9BASI|nr:hypothetical protein PCASD_24907 [Puccinia coronata f. sp. avenae]